MEVVDVILVGMGNYGSGLMENLLRRKNNIVGIDFDLGVLDNWRKRGIPVLYGNMADPEMYEQLPLKKARWVISAIRSKEMSLALIHNLKKEGFTGKVALTASSAQETAAFERAGADLVFQPFNSRCKRT